MSSFTRGNISPENLFPIQFVVVGEVVTFVKRIDTHIMSNITDKNGTSENHLAKRMVMLIVSYLVNNLSQSSESILSSFILSLSVLVIMLLSEIKVFRRIQKSPIQPTIINEITVNVHMIASVGPCDFSRKLFKRLDTAASISAFVAFGFVFFNSLTASSLNCL